MQNGRSRTRQEVGKENRTDIEEKAEWDRNNRTRREDRKNWAGRMGQE
jgi:hypothetical protein